jgi:trimeric autotransporter adhesin
MYDGIVTGNHNLAMGYLSLENLTGGIGNIALGREALETLTVGNNNVAVGSFSLEVVNSSENTAVGNYSGQNNTTTDQVFIGYEAGQSTTSGAGQTFVGHSAGKGTGTALTGTNNTAVGRDSGLVLQGNAYSNTFVGANSGGGVTTGDENTYIGNDAGVLMTSGSQNTILGAFDGNQDGLDIRTSSNNIVLSDGDGNPRLHIDSSGNLLKLGSGQIRSTGTNGLSVFAANIITVGDGATITLSAGSSAQLICIACGSTGTGGTFFANYNTLVSQLGGSASGVSTTDAGVVDIAVYKTINDNTVTFKNRSGATRVYHMSIFCASNGGLS